MASQTQTLDTWSYRELVDEAIGLLPSAAPEWTNHNAADPGITLLELLAYFTEILIFQTGQLTDADRLGFLRLMRGEYDVPELGGEALEAALAAAVLQQRTPERAVTAQDFELLSCRADKRVGRAICRPQVNFAESSAMARMARRVGHVSVALLPAEGVAETEMPEILRVVSAFLDERRILTTRVHVTAARISSFTIRVQISAVSGVPGESAVQAGRRALLRFLDPVRGGVDGKGWPMGRAVFISDLYRVLTSQPEIRHAQREVEVPSGRELEELVPDNGELDRLQRNPRGELISYAMEPDELPGDVTILLTESPSAAGTPGRSVL
ncbi:hypothetical protein FTW19_17700 [Terriglobus albidus]|uniref:Baseplate protein J-like domain-containing protein n=1 Tax=Terriglobus albidus TaxID=1592106 RepID=A0A5B9ED74_9BACT|nr:hypothetical protein [Terriglobus albidus]QEE29659.1 hypothetical protein FTW19_17700 [Terriglobus albidus]